MKKLLVLLFSILISFNSYGGWFDKDVCLDLDTDFQIKDELLYLTNETEPFSGKFLCEYENGEDKSKGNIEDGKRDGRWLKWYDNGQIKTVDFYDDGKLDGQSSKWDKNGQKTFEAFYIDGKLGVSDKKIKEDKKIAKDKKKAEDKKIAKDKKIADKKIEEDKKIADKKIEEDKKIAEETGYASYTYSDVNNDVGCKSTYSKEKRKDIFNDKYKNIWLKWRGEIMQVSSDKVSLNIDNFGLQDLRVTFENKGDGYDLREEQFITVRFSMKSIGGCFLPFGGERATIVN